MTKVITIERDAPVITNLPEDYMAYHFTFHKGLYKLLCPHKRNGIDVIFLYRQKNIRSFCKKIDRFWHNLRKTVTKQEFSAIKCRTVLQMVGTYEQGEIMIQHFNDLALNPPPNWKFPIR